MSIATALTALADDVSAAKAAITAKGGTAPNGTADMADAIAAIPSGGGLPYSQITEITLIEELNSYGILQAMGAKCKYRNSQIYMFIYSDVAAVGGGNYTNNNYLLRHRGTTVIGGWLDQVTSKIPPSNIVLKGGTNYSTEGASKVEADGSFTFRKSTASVLAPIGSKCIVLEQAWTNENGVFDDSLWGE